MVFTFIHGILLLRCWVAEECLCTDFVACNFCALGFIFQPYASYCPVKAERSWKQKGDINNDCVLASWLLGPYH